MFRPRTARLQQAIVSIYWVRLYVPPWLLVIGVSWTSFMVDGSRSKGLLALLEEETVPSRSAVVGIGCYKRNSLYTLTTMNNIFHDNPWVHSNFRLRSTILQNLMTDSFFFCTNVFIDFENFVSAGLFQNHNKTKWNYNCDYFVFFSEAVCWQGHHYECCQRFSWHSPSQDW